MKIEKVRIKHFQCIADTEELPLDERLTVLVGANESGKSAIQRALSYFNPENNFSDADISTVSGIRDLLGDARVARRDVEVVTVWITLSEEDLIAAGLRGEPGAPRRVKITKTLDNEYRIETLDVLPPIAGTAHERLGQLLGELRNKIEKVYTGRIKRKLLTDSFAWVERFEGENVRDNLVLFPEWAPGTWDELKAGDRIQVTKVEADPYGRNSRALNAGLAIDTQPLTSALDGLLGEVAGREAEGHALKALQQGVNEIPPGHPLRDYLSKETMDEIARLAVAEAQPQKKPTELLSLMGGAFPQFVYLSSVPDVGSSVPVKSLIDGPTDEAEALLASLVRAAGLRPQAVVQEDEVSRKKDLEAKSESLTRRLREHWSGKDLSVAFEKDGQRLAIWVRSEGSGDPPARKSKGLSYYVAFFAKLAEVSTKRNVVLLLDDPGVYLHPLAQRQILPLLDSQPFQVIMATHLPFMIDPDHLERIRVVTRVPEGTKVSPDWAGSRESLLPVWGSLLGYYAGRAWLIVEGPNDKRAYLRASKACEALGRAYLPPDVPVVPAGGSNVEHLVRELIFRGVSVAVLLDGDAGGRQAKKNLLKIAGVNASAVVALDELDLGIENPKEQKLFADRDERDRAFSRNPHDEAEHGFFAAATLGRFEKVFARVNEALKVAHPS